VLPEQERALARAATHRAALKAAFRKLRVRPPRDLDDRFHALHTEVFGRTDCLTCANCCRTTSPIFRDRDVERAARRLRMRPAAFEAQYLRRDEDGDLVLQSAPCPFLDLGDHRCSIYEDRPAACREYPHTDRKHMAGILPLTERNAHVCPAVAEMALRIAGVT
jgi:Fe-S-cluster containining protein